jgi:hypothetical protein
MEDAAPGLGIRLQSLGVRGAAGGDVQNVIADAARAGATALVVIEETMLLANRTLILDDRIPRGSKPADPPVEQPTRFERSNCR